MTLTGSAYIEFCNSCAHREAFKDMLYQSYIYVKETVPTLRAVLAECPTHPLANTIARSCEEESGHDRMLIEDLAKLGSVPEGMVSPSIQQFVHYVRSIATMPDPVSALYGEIMILEGHSRTTEQVKALATMFGVPLDAASTFMEHAEVDVTHAKWALDAIKHPSISQSTVIESAIHVARLFRRHWQWMTVRHSQFPTRLVLEHLGDYYG